MPTLPQLPVRIRPAIAGDADGIRQVATTTWTATYKDLLTPANIAGFLAQAYRPEVIEARIVRSHLGSFVAEYQMPPQRGTIAGYAFVGPYIINGQNPLPGEGELYALYVSPSAQGKGIGLALWEAATAWLKTGDRWSMHIGVLVANQSARAFYERQGARLDHIEDVVIGTQTISEAWYRCTIT